MTQYDHDARHRQMTTEPLGRLITRLAVPSIIGMLVTAAYNLVDTFFVARIDTPSAAALGVVFSFCAAVQAIGFFFGQGAGNFMSRSLGRRDAAQASRMASVGFYSGIVLAIGISAAAIFTMGPVLKALGATPTVLPVARRYDRWIILGTPAVVGSFVLNNLMRHQGNARDAMVGLCSGAVLNMALDPVLIFWAGWGIDGAGVATCLSQYVGLAVLALQSRRGVRIRLSEFRPSRFLYREIAACGLPSLARQGLAALAAVLFNRVASTYGDAALAAFSIGNRLFMLLGSAMIGYGQGFQPVCGFNYGAGLFGRVKAAYRHSLRVSVLYMVAIGALVWVFAPQVMQAFRGEDPRVVEIGTSVIRYQSLTLPLMGFVIITNMLLQNIRAVWPATILSSCRRGILFIPVLYTAVAMWGLRGAELTQAITDVLSALVAVPLVRSAFAGMPGDAGAPVDSPPAPGR